MVVKTRGIQQTKQWNFPLKDSVMKVGAQFYRLAVKISDYVNLFLIQECHVVLKALSTSSTRNRVLTLK